MYVTLHTTALKKLFHRQTIAQYGHKGGFPLRKWTRPGETCERHPSDQRLIRERHERIQPDFEAITQTKNLTKKAIK